MATKIMCCSPLPAMVVKYMITEASGVSDIEIVEAHNKPLAEMIEKIKDVEIILADYTFVTKLTREMIVEAKKCKLIQQPNVGYQAIDVEACTEMGIKVANTAGANTIGVAEHAITLALVLLKNFVYAMKSTKEAKWDQMGVDSAELGGKTWGLIGMGNIGKAIAERILPFGAKIIYYDKYRLTEEMEKKYSATYTELPDLLKTSNIVSLHLPLTDETMDLMNAERIAMMKPFAFLINVGRGELVDEQALAEALKKKKLAGAGLDVFRIEPITADNPFLDVDRAVITPHVAGATKESKKKIMDAAMGNVAKVLKGGVPDFVVN